ncbi:UDP-forming cellulose synthase catalytic subunit [Prosthecomicrobium pneumaticum]|uniref:Cellulose synthase catalytic subunit [UDP-forming] n=1 Tax=Prosthecomicrobium pneumaticum TaxID=81895 RepID=A0A7W9FL47_9HYPH|nr:UDP-forming cellulose synthase catalytic subunit [Prosthecomicrobium pneumaticum]MBB5752368.1 cellulose synthase (UDP-forming) [Prosthecomicrobium pneumaticum]
MRFVNALLWGLAALVVIVMITLPINLQAHLVAGTIVVGAMIVLKFFNFGGIWRQVALALGTSIVLRYVYWRTTSTLPPINQPEDFIPGLMLYLAEMYNVLMLGISLFVVSAPLPSRDLVVSPQDEDLPTVDVFVPTYNEEPELLAMTVAAAMAMEYPKDKFTVWLLDDGGTRQKREATDIRSAAEAIERRRTLEALCESLGARYLTRDRNQHAKAGNLNNGLAHSTGELVCVFDADHAPARDFLLRTVGYFRRDPKLFLVQTPHFFLNPDPIERNLKTFDRMPSENDMFYGIIQRGLDKWDASFFCGSAAVLRREALVTTKGFSGVSITEDAETALELHAKGWHSVYVDKPLIAGLQPATFTSFIGQRSRWAQGMMQILRLRVPPLKRGLSLPQRLCYMSSTLFWLFPFTRWAFLLAPLGYLFFDLEIFIASGAEFMSYTFSYMIVNMMMQNYLYGRYRWPWVSELYEFVQSVYLLPAVISVFLNPRKPTFKVTAKNESLDRSFVSELGTPFFLIFLLLSGAVAMTVWRTLTEPYKADVTMVVGAWNIFNLLMAGCALGVVSERAESRASQRVPVQRRAELLHGDRVLPAVIEDVSVGGARVGIAADAGVPRGAIARIRFSPHDGGPALELPVEIRAVDRTDNGAMLRVQYRPAETKDYSKIADLVFANSDVWTRIQNNRRVNPGILRGTVWFLRTALFQTGRGLTYYARMLRPARPAADPAAEAGGR